MRAAERWDVIPGGEPSHELTARVRGAIERMAAAHPGQQLAVVIHGGIIGTILALATGSRPFAFIAADNGSISELVVAGDHWTVRRYNDTSHLDKTVTKP
jgi:probable phosphoglycerate mutase